MSEEDSEIWWDSLSDEDFQLTFRMSRKTTIALQAEIEEIENIPNDEEATDQTLLFCLWYLGNTSPVDEGLSLFDLPDDLEGVLVQNFQKITSLGVTYLAWPEEEEAKIVEASFNREYGFPGVVGVIGSLHINIKSQEQDSIYYNSEMQSDTIVLQVVSDNNLLLRDVCAGFPGGKDVKTILKSSPLYEKLTNKDEYLVKNNKHLLGGTLHPPMKTLLTPYKGKTLTHRRNQFNILHNSVMYTVEKTFRCLENRFPRLTAVDNLGASTCTLLVSAICVLHNFTRVRNDNCDNYLA